MCQGETLVAVSQLVSGLCSSRRDIAGDLVLQGVGENDVDRGDRWYVETDNLVRIDLMIYNNFTFAGNKKFFWSAGVERSCRWSDDIFDVPDERL